MRQVKCISPHGALRRGDQRLGLPPADGGYVSVPALGRDTRAGQLPIAVGDTVDAPGPPAFIADGFHFADAATGGADQCTAAGPSCWCGGAQHDPPPVPEADSSAAPHADGDSQEEES